MAATATTLESNAEIRSPEETMEAQCRLLHDVSQYVGAFALKCAIELNMFETINAHGGRMTHSELVSKSPDVSPLKAKHLGRLALLLAHMGYLRVQKNGGGGGGDGEGEVAYSLTELSALLVDDNQTWCALGYLNFPEVKAVYHLSDWFKSDRSGCAFSLANGKPVWELASESPGYNLTFNECGASDTRMVMKLVVDRCKDAFHGLCSLVDVGGGTGTAARAIAEAFPAIKCTVYDLPHVIASMPESPLVDAVEGNMFESVPTADAIFLKHILHDWNDENCVKILKKCKDAMPANGGKVIVLEMIVNDRKDSTELLTQMFLDIGVMAILDGKERQEHEWKKIFTAAGFTRYKISPVGLMRSLIELFP